MLHTGRLKERAFQKKEFLLAVMLFGEASISKGGGGRNTFWTISADHTFVITRSTFDNFLEGLKQRKEIIERNCVFGKCVVETINLKTFEPLNLHTFKLKPVSF